MPRHQLDKPNNVHGPYELAKGRLKFNTGDSGMIQRLQADKAANRLSTVLMMSGEQIEEFTGCIESVELVKVDRPQQWQVVMTEQAPRPRKRG